MSIALKNDAGTFSTNINQSNPTANVNITLPTDSGTMALTENVVGVGQTWQDVGPSRASGVTYTNTTGKPIQLVCGHFNSGGGTPTWVIGGISITAATNANSVGITSVMSFIVPNGTTYKYHGVISIWWELR